MTVKLRNGVLTGACAIASLLQLSCSTFTAPLDATLALAIVNGTNRFTVLSIQQIGRGLPFICGSFAADWEVRDASGSGATITRREGYLLELDGEVRARTDIQMSLAVPKRGGVHFTTQRANQCGYQHKDLPMELYLSVTVRDRNGRETVLQGKTTFS